MPSAARLSMVSLDALTNPVTFRYNLSTPWGRTPQELTIDIPELIDNAPATGSLATRIWNDAIASALSHNCLLEYVEMVRWKAGPAVTVVATGAPAGLSSLSGTDRDHAGVLTLHSGHSDRFSRRLLFMPSIPHTFVDGNVLSDAGLNRLYDTAAVLFMGCAGFPLTGPMSWWIAYPHVVDVTTDNFFGVAFRRVEWVRVHNYCARAFDTIPLDWP